MDKQKEDSATKLYFIETRKNVIDYGSFIKPRSKSYVKEHKETDEFTVVTSLLVNPMNSCGKLESKTDGGSRVPRKYLKNMNLHHTNSLLSIMNAER